MGCTFLFTVSLSAQNDESFEQYRTRKRAEFNDYKERRRKEFEEYRRKRNEEFARYLRNTWETVNPKPFIPIPEEKPVPPIVVPEDEVTPVVQPSPIPYDEVIPVPRPRPQPQPVNPIEELPVTVPVSPAVSVQAFSFFGTSGKVRMDKTKLIRLNTLSENNIADAWLKLSEDSYTNLIHDCLQIRKSHALCDWAYLMMLQQMSNALCGKGTNEAELLMAYVYCQSGYKMRLAIGKGKLHMLFASEHIIYNWDYYVIDGEQYYVFDRTKGELQICAQAYPKEQSMSLLVSKEQKLVLSETETSVHQSKKYPEMKVEVKVNRNMLDFYSSYPTSKIGNNMVSRWALYANTPLTESVRRQVYPQIRKAISGCDQLTAVNKILNLVQTGFVYEYDDKVWGYDRAFFAEESLHYPYCDCEDRSILLTRIIRDLLGLKCILIYYPGHLSSAVAFTEGNPTGDYIEYKGYRFFIADGTITGYGAPVGRTMSGMDNKTAKIILLE